MIRRKQRIEAESRLNAQKNWQYIIVEFEHIAEFHKVKLVRHDLNLNVVVGSILNNDTFNG